MRYVQLWFFCDHDDCQEKHEELVANHLAVSFLPDKWFRFFTPAPGAQTELTFCPVHAEAGKALQAKQLEEARKLSRQAMSGQTLFTASAVAGTQVYGSSGGITFGTTNPGLIGGPIMGTTSYR